MFVGSLALLLLWWFFTTWNYLPIIILAVLLLAYFFKVARRIFTFLLALLLLAWLLIQTDFVQNIIIGNITKRLSKDLKTQVSIKHVSFGLFNSMNLDTMLIRDQQKDTLVYAAAIKVRITDWFFWKTYADLKYIGMEDAIIKQQRHDSVWNYKFLADYFSSSDTTAKKDSSKGLVFNFKKIDLKNVTYLVNDEWIGQKMTVKVGSAVVDADSIDIDKSRFLINSVELDKPYFVIENFDGKRPEEQEVNEPDTGLYFNTGGLFAKVKSITLTNGYFGNLKRGDVPDKGAFDGSNIQVEKINGTLSNLTFIKDTIKAVIDLNAKERSGFDLKKLKANFRLTPQIMEFKGLDIVSGKSHVTDYYAMRFRDFNKDLGEYVEKVVMDAHFKNAQVSSDDVAYFAPALSSWKKTVELSGKYYGTVENFSIKDLFLRTGNTTYLSGNLVMKGLPHAEKTTLNLSDAIIQANIKDIAFLYPAMVNITQPNLAALGDIRFQGSVDGTLFNYNLNGNLSTLLGGLYTTFTLGFPSNGEPTYKGNIQTEQFNLGKFINSDLFGNIGFTGDVDGYSYDLDKLKTSINGNFSSLEFNGYKYSSLAVNGSIEKRKFDGDFKADDPNFDFTSHIEIDLTGAEPVFNILGDLAIARLKQLNFTPKDNFQLTGLFDLNFQGRNIDEFTGSAKLLNASLLHDSTRLSFDSLSVNSYLDSANEKVLTAVSNQFDAKIVGKQYSILGLSASFQAFFSNYYPSYIAPPRMVPQGQDFSIIINTRDFDKYTKLIDTNFTGIDNAQISGSINTADSAFNLTIKLPNARYKKYRLEDALIQGAGNYNSLKLTGNIGKIFVSDSLYFPNSRVNIQSANDYSTVHIATSANTTLNDAQLNADVFTMADGVHIDFEPSSFVLNDKTWNLEKQGEIVIKQNFASASNVKFTQGFQEIAVESEQSDSSNLIVKLKNISIGDFAPLFTKKPRMEGIMSGNIYLRDFYNKFNADADVQAEQFRLDDDSVGDVPINVKYNTETGRVSFDVKSNNLNYVFGINGYYDTRDTAKSPLNIHSHLTKAKIGLLNEFLSDIFSNVTGYASGDLATVGDPSAPQFIGKVLLTNGGLTVNYTQVRYAIDSATIVFNDNSIDFGQLKIRDKFGNTGMLTHGILYEKGFKNMRFDFEMATSKMLLLDTKPKDNQQFYGKAIGRASLSFKGPVEDMRMSIAGEVNDTTHIYIPTSNSKESSEADFIHFKQYGKEIQTVKQNDNSRLSVDLDLTANNKAEIDVILDELTGDVIKATGNGRLKIQVPYNGKITMKGRYNIEQGSYDFNFQSLIKKPFDLLPDANSYIEWTDDPYNANIHIEAQYTAKNVSLSDLISNTGYQLGGAVQGYRGEVYVIATLTQKLAKPKIDFRIDFPQGSPIKNDQNFALFLNKLQGDDNEVLKQVTWLIVFGSFAPYGESVGSGTNDNLVRSASINTISEKISSEVNKMVTGLLTKVGVQFDVTASTYSSSELYGSSTVNRLDRQNIGVKFNKSLMNGKLVVTVGSGFDFNISNAAAIQSNNFQWLPDISVQILLSRNVNRGTQLKAIVFNKSSLDVNTANGGIGRTTRQGVSISYSIDFPVDRPTADKNKPLYVPSVPLQKGP